METVFSRDAPAGLQSAELRHEATCSARSHLCGSWRPEGYPGFRAAQRARYGSISESPLGNDAEFYLENIPAGRYSAGVEYEAGTCQLELHILASERSQVNPGTVRAKLNSGKNHEEWCDVGGLSAIRKLNLTRRRLATNIRVARNRRKLAKKTA
jgi:hypothetical protein